LYLNRKCNPAQLVGAHIPSADSICPAPTRKTGGKDYLLLFLQAKTVAQKL